MSDPYAQRDSAQRLDQTQTIERAPLYLLWAQRTLNPFPLASSGGVWGDQAQPWAVNILAFYCEVFVLTTNNGTNFWTVELINQNDSLNIASFTTAAIAANTWTRFAVTTGITQPASTNVVLSIQLTATLSPGAIYIAPAVALLRTGN